MSTGQNEVRQTESPWSTDDGRGETPFQVVGGLEEKARLGRIEHAGAGARETRLERVRGREGDGRGERGERYDGRDTVVQKGTHQGLEVIFPREQGSAVIKKKKCMKSSSAMHRSQMPPLPVCRREPTESWADANDADTDKQPMRGMEKMEGVEQELGELKEERRKEEQPGASTQSEARCRCAVPTTTASTSKRKELLWHLNVVGPARTAALAT